MTALTKTMHSVNRDKPERSLKAMTLFELALTIILGGFASWVAVDAIEIISTLLGRG